MNVKILQVAVLLLPMSGRGDCLSPGMGMGSGPGWLSIAEPRRRHQAAATERRVRWPGRW